MKYYMKITHTGGKPISITICAKDRYEAFIVAVSRCSDMELNVVSTTVEYVSI